MKIRSITSVLCLALALACTKQEGMPQGGSNEAVQVGVALCNNGAALTKASWPDLTIYEPLVTSTKIRFFVSGKWVGNTPNPVVLEPLGIAGAGADGKNLVSFDSENIFYWDQFGVADPTNSEGRNEGLTFGALAINDGTTDVKAELGGTMPADWDNIPWYVDTDGDVNNIMKRDLIYGSLQDGVPDNRYKYANRSTPARIEMHHALSQVTVYIQAGEGFPTDGTIGATTNKFESDPVFTLTSNGFNMSGNPEYVVTRGTVKALSDQIIPSTLAADKTALVTQTVKTDDPTWTVIKKGLMFPGTVLGRAADSDIIATVTADGNVYDITAKKMRAAMAAVQTGPETYLALRNYNYEFKIILKKTGISVEAAVEKWVDVTAAEEEAKIRFTADIVNSVITNPASSARADLTTTGSSFSLYSATATSAFTDAFVASPSSTYTYDGTEFVASPKLYWQNLVDNRYFRTLAKTTAASTDAAPATTAITTNSLQMSGDDVLWGTTAAHTGKEEDNTEHTFTEGQLITPRTGTVPLMFYHAGCQVTLNLTTTTGDDAVNIVDAKVKFSGVKTEGTVNLSTGVVTASNAYDFTHNSNSTGGVLDHEYMIPQTLGNDVILTITVKDKNSNTEYGTEYTVQLNKCKVDGTSTAIGAWESGKHYIYTLTLKKAALDVTASVAAWKNVTSTTEVWF